MAGSEHQWELTKENIQPLKQGRGMASLQTALVPQCKDILEDRRKEFETQLRTYTGHDPLHVWHTYILWLEQHYPAGGRKLNMVGLLEKCITQFYTDQKYQSDLRFLDVWLRYAFFMNDAGEVFNTMRQGNICTSLAKFYVAVSNYHESKGNTCAASSVLEEGLQRCARPESALLTAKSQLEARVGRSVMQAIEGGDDVAVGESGMLPPAGHNARSVLGALKPHGKKGVVGTTRVGEFKLSTQGGVSAGFSKKDVQKAAGNKRKVQVLDDENAAAPSLVSAPVPFTEASAKSKENTQQAGKWSKAKAPQNRAPVNSVPVQKFQIHEEESANVLTPLPSAVPTNVLSSRKATAFSDWITPRMLFEPHNPKTRAMYDKHKVYAGTTEFQFEEIRYAKMQAQQLEQERKEKEAARDQEIEELRAKVENLTRLLERLQTGGKGASTERDIETVKRRISLAEASILAGKGDCTPALPSQHTSECEPSSSSGVESDGTGQGKRKNNATTDESRVVRGLWDGTLSTEEIGAANRSGDAVAANRAEAFEVFADPTNVIKGPYSENDEGRADNNAATSDPENAAHNDVEPALEEQDENCAPVGYVPPEKPLRRLSGILQPSEGIPVAPIEGDDEKDQNEDDMAGVRPFHDDDNITNFGSSSVFVKKVTSTPFPTENELHQAGEDFTLGPLAALNAITIPDDKKERDQGTQSAMMARPNITMNHVTRDLSVILECSKETSSKSGSSSSGSSASSISGHGTSGWVSRHQTAPLSAVEEQVEESNNVPLECQAENSVQPTSVPLDPFGEQVQPTSVPLDPFSEQLQRSIMTHAKVPPEERPEFFYLDRNVPQMRIGSCITLGSQGDQYYISQQLAQGAFGKVYLAKVISEGTVLSEDGTCLEEDATEVILKVVKGCTNLWEFYIVTELAERLNASDLPSVNKSVASVYAGAFYNNGSILAMPYCEYGTLLNLANMFKKHGETVPECLVLYITLEMLIVLAKMHSMGIIHGDVKPDNVLIMDFPDSAESLSNLAKGTSCVCFIDMGRGIDMKNFESGTTFNCVVNTEGFQCIEMQEGRPWTYQTDWYGLLGCVHILLFGSYMEAEKKPDGTWGTKQKFKRYWKNEIWTKLFTTLLNIPSCSEIPDVTPIIWTIHAAFQDGKLLQELIVRVQKAKWMIKNV